MSVKKGQKGRASDFQMEFTLGENVAQGDALALALFTQDVIDTSKNIDYTGSASGNSYMSSNPISQSFVVPAGVFKIKDIYFTDYDLGNGGHIDMEVRKSTLGGTLVASGTFNNSYSGYYTPVLANVNLAVTPGDTYFLILKNPSQAIQTYKVNSVATHYGTTQENGGSPITSFTWAFKIIFYAKTLTAKRWYKASSQALDQRMNFKGFAIAAGSAGARMQVCSTSVYDGLSGLTQDGDYYLQDTPGLISGLPGTIKRWVGIAKSGVAIDRLLGTRQVVTEIIGIPDHGVYGDFVMPFEGIFVANLGYGQVNGVGFGDAFWPCSILVTAGDILAYDQTACIRQTQ